MIHISFQNIDALKSMHYEAVKSYVKDIMRAADRNGFYSDVRSLPAFNSLPETFDFEKGSYDWLEKFILAEPQTLREWVNNNPERLKFLSMKRLYLNRFAKGSANFVDRDNAYNSNTLFKEMGIKVCPYCEHEYIEIVTVGEDNKERRTMEFDHFYPKGDDEYPGLAMCFFNLIPSCKSCNQLKMTNPLAANPYEWDIEALTCLKPDLPIGVNMESVKKEDCKIRLHATGGMIVNDTSLALEQRYDTQTNEAYRLLKAKQNNSDEKLLELERMGYGKVEDRKFELFGNPRSEAFGKELHTKMKEDLIGY